ncbi:MAG TPA: hypothetical protein VH722_13000 [Alphaproteobacteria bacterium]|nr:hypothetical protein [Alphaproteobacteria bacterium]
MLLATGLVPVSADVCPPPQTEIRVSGAISAPSIDDSRSLDQLKAMNLKGTLPEGMKSADTVGITAATISVDSEIRTRNAGPANGPTCVWPSVVSVKLSSAPNIYVDSSHGKCRQDVATRHELRHVEIDKDIIERYLPIFRARLKAMTDAIGAVQIASPDDLPKARGRIEEKINAMLSVTYDMLASDRGQAQADFDSPAEYRRVSAACSGVSVDASTVPAARPPSIGGRRSYTRLQ